MLWATASDMVHLFNIKKGCLHAETHIDTYICISWRVMYAAIASDKYQAGVPIVMVTIWEALIPESDWMNWVVGESFYSFVYTHTLLLALVRLARRNLTNITMWLKKVLMPNVGLESRIMLTTKVVLSFLHVLYCFKPMAPVHVELCSYYDYLSSFIANKNCWCHQRLNIGWRLLFFNIPQGSSSICICIAEHNYDHPRPMYD